MEKEKSNRKKAKKGIQSRWRVWVRCMGVCVKPTSAHKQRGGIDVQKSKSFQSSTPYAYNQFPTLCRTTAVCVKIKKKYKILRTSYSLYIGL
jgi:hypothetical protein